MPFQPAMKVAANLVSQIEAAAALAAQLGANAAPMSQEVDQAAAAVVAELDASAFTDLSPDEARMIHGFLRSFLHQAIDLVESPSRAAGWSFDDPVILENIGQVSRSIVRGLAVLAEEEPALADRLSQPARFLDAGTGVGWIAIDAARRWPSLHVTGIDLFDPALAIAARNVAASGLDARVSLLRQDVTELSESDSYAMAFLAAPFMPQEVIRTALPKLFTALEPGGWLAFGIFEAPADPLSQALLNLRVTRFGGRIWTIEEARSALAQAGFTTRAATIAMLPARLIIGRRSVE